MSGPGHQGWGVLPAGAVVAGYRVERLLGVGGMGAVYVVANPELPRYDALKVLSAELSHNEEFRTRFIREADVASRLDHPNIVSIYRRGQTENGLLWIAMQLVDGTDADEALKTGAMTPVRAVYIVGEVAKALDYAHSRQVVHRDIKPANFLLAGPVGEERVLLGDFGIARGFDDAGLTATGSLMATVAYTAPEVLAGGHFDARADLYSLGCTLFRLLTGKTPYSGANGPAAVMMAHLQAPPPRVTDAVAGLSPALDAVIAKAMAKDPAQRFSCARELAEAAAGLVLAPAGTTTRPWQPVPTAAVNSDSGDSGGGPRWGPAAGPLTQQGQDAAHTQWGASQIARTPARVRRPRWLVPAVAVTVALLAAAVVSVIVVREGTDGHPNAAAPPTSQTTTTTVPPSPVPPMDPKAIDALLPSAEQVAKIMGASQLAVARSLDGLSHESLVMADLKCIGAYSPVEAEVYQDSGFNAVRLQAIHEPGEASVNFEIVDGVVEFPTADAAQKSFRSQSAQWAACADTTFTLTYPGVPPQEWRFGPLGTRPTVIAMKHALVDPKVNPMQGACQHALAVRNNVLADVWACRAGIGDQAVAIANAILARVPQ